VLFAIMMALSLVLAPAPPWEWRLVAGSIALALAWSRVAAIIFQRGRAAVRQFEWAGDGVWRIRDRSGRWEHASLAPETAAVGPWILLVWNACQEGDHLGNRCPNGRRYCLIDAADVSQSAFRALRGRLKFFLPRPGQGSPQ
jgi:hypothetical protein